LATQILNKIKLNPEENGINYPAFNIKVSKCIRKKHKLPFDVGIERRLSGIVWLGLKFIALPGYRNRALPLAGFNVNDG